MQQWPDCMTSTQLTKFCRFATKGQFPPAEHRLGEARRPGQVVRGNTEKGLNDLWWPETQSISYQILPSKEISTRDRPFPTLCAQSGFQCPVVTTQHLQLTLQPGAATDYHPSLQKRKDGILLRCPKTANVRNIKFSINPRLTRRWLLSDHQVLEASGGNYAITKSLTSHVEISWGQSTSETMTFCSSHLATEMETLLNLLCLQSAGRRCKIMQL